MASKKKDKKELGLHKQGTVLRPNEHHEELTYHDYISDEMINSWHVCGDLAEFLVD